MNNIHKQKVIDAFRTLDPLLHPKLKKWADNLTDDEIAAQMFRNPKLGAEKDSSGKLTTNGTKLLKTIYTFWEVKIEHPLTARQQLRLGRACRLPYYFSNTEIVCFEAEVGVWLALIRDNIDLMDNVLP